MGEQPTHDDAVGITFSSSKKKKTTYQDFTPAEQACISKNVSEKVKEGMDQDQAIAASISICAPEKATAKQAETKESKAAIKGGEYDSDQNQNGTWNIRNVPIFAEHIPPEMPNKKIDRQWLQKAVDVAKRRFLQDQYVAPLHIGHHGSENSTIEAGKVFPKRVVKQSYEGKQKDVLLADLLEIPEDVFKMIRAGRLSYRSVEVLDINKPEISSLAFLSHNVPFFRFPNLTTGKEVTAQQKFSKEMYPALAYQAWKGTDTPGGLFIFRFDGESMSEETKTVIDKQEVARAEHETEEEKKKKEEKKDDKAERADEGQMAAVLDRMMKILEALASKAGISGPAAQEAQEDGPVNLQKEEKTPVEYAAFKGELVALAGRVKSMENEKKATELVRSAQSALKEYNLGESAEKELQNLATKGEDHVNTYVAAIQKHATKMPASLDKVGLGTEGDDKLIAAYQEKGPEYLEAARKFGKQYDAADGKLKISKEVFVRENVSMELEGSDF